MAPVILLVMAAFFVALGYGLSQWLWADSLRFGAGVVLGLISASTAVMAFSFGLLHRQRQQTQRMAQVLEDICPGKVSLQRPLDVADDVPDLVDRLEDLTGPLREHVDQLGHDRDHLRTVMDSMIEGVIAVDRTEQVLLVNDTACQLFDLSRDVLVNRPIWELIRHPELQHWVRQVLDGFGRSGGELETRRLINAKTLSVRVAPLPGVPPRGAVVVVDDVTDLRKLERVRQEFVANASHELKTPLASIQANIETLLDGALTDQRAARRFIKSIGKQSERLSTLVMDLLSLARLEAGETETPRHPVDLAATVETCLQRHRPKLERHQLDLVVEPPESPLQIIADDESLQQILDNLIDNAIKYTPQGGAVSVRWEQKDSHAILEVTDTGIGIPRRHLDRIFERFYRVDRARSRSLGGTGLGLSIVKHLTQTLGGRVEVESEYGEGTTFLVYLPLRPAGYASNKMDDAARPPASELLLDENEPDTDSMGELDSEAISDMEPPSDDLPKDGAPEQAPPGQNDGDSDSGKKKSKSKSKSKKRPVSSAS